MMASKSYNFKGRELLNEMGASWFVSYFYHLHIDEAENCWKKVSTSQSIRIPVFNKTKQYHADWLKQIVKMNDASLETNHMGLTAERIKQMAKSAHRISILRDPNS